MSNMPENDKDLVRDRISIPDEIYSLADGFVSFELSENIPDGYFAVVTLSSRSSGKQIIVSLTEDQYKALKKRLNPLTPNMEYNGQDVAEIQRFLTEELDISFGEA